MKEIDRSLILGSREIIERFVIEQKDPTFRVNFLPVNNEIFHEGEFDVKVDWNDPNSRLRKMKNWHAYVRFKWEGELEAKLRIWKIGQGTMRALSKTFLEHGMLGKELRITAQAVIPNYQSQHFLKIDEEDITYIEGGINYSELEEMKKYASYEEIREFVDRHVKAMNRMCLGEKLGIL